MTTGEDEAELVVLQVVVVPFPRGGVPLTLLERVQVLELLAASSSSECIDRLEPGSRDQPGPWIGGDAIARPYLEGGTEGVLKRLFRLVDIAEPSDQRGQHATRFCGVDRCNLL